MQDQSDADFAIRAAPTSPSASATSLRPRLAPSQAGSSPWASAVYFAANDAGSGTELWKTDGTEAGTVRVKDISGRNVSRCRAPHGGRRSPVLHRVPSDTGVRAVEDRRHGRRDVPVSDIAPGSRRLRGSRGDGVGGAVYFKRLRHLVQLRALAKRWDAGGDGHWSRTSTRRDLRIHARSSSSTESCCSPPTTARAPASGGPTARPRARSGRERDPATDGRASSPGWAPACSSGQRLRQRHRAVDDRRHGVAGTALVKDIYPEAAPLPRPRGSPSVGQTACSSPRPRPHDRHRAVRERRDGRRARPWSKTSVPGRRLLHRRVGGAGGPGCSS